MFILVPARIGRLAFGYEYSMSIVAGPGKKGSKNAVAEQDRAKPCRAHRPG